VGDVDRSSPFHASIVIGSRKAHQVKFITSQNPTLMEFRDISCFCVQCQNPTIDLPCEQIHFYQPTSCIFLIWSCPLLVDSMT
jgi:hypothetical protein